jgi:hypothetical protein
MLKKSLVFGGIALVAFTLLVLVGCPDVVSNGNTPPPNTGQGDLTVTAAAAAGARTIGVELTSGKFIENLDTNTTVRKDFQIKNGTSDFNLGDNPTYKLSSDRKVFTITPGGTGAEEIHSSGTLTVTIPKEAIDSSAVVGQGGAQVGTSPIQADIAVQTSAAQAAIGANAIVVTLSQGSFVSTITGADFIHEATSTIVTDNDSEVELTDGRTATIYGKNAAVSQGTVKVGINESALVGYPVVTATDVTVSGVTKAGQRLITVSITPVSGDDFITIELNAGTFKADAVAGNFTLIPGSSTIGAVTGLQLKSDDEKAVIKVGTPFTDANPFTLKIAAAAFAAGTTVYRDNVTTAVTTRQADVVVTPIDTSSNTEEVLTIIIVNGGKFVTSPAIELFRQTGTEAAEFTGSPTLSNNNTVAKITLNIDTTDSKTLGVNIEAEAFDPDFLVELDDISLSLGDT